jgi:hypothetical protein
LRFTSKGQINTSANAFAKKYGDLMLCEKQAFIKAKAKKNQVISGQKHSGRAAKTCDKVKECTVFPLSHGFLSPALPRAPSARG